MKRAIALIVLLIFVLSLAGANALVLKKFPPVGMFAKRITGRQVAPAPFRDMDFSFTSREGLITNLQLRVYSSNVNFMAPNGEFRLHFYEASSANQPNVGLNDYFIVNGPTRFTHVFRYIGHDAINRQLSLLDIATGNRQIVYDATGKGNLIAGGITFAFLVDTSTGKLAIDQDGDGVPSGVQAVIVDIDNKEYPQEYFTGMLLAGCTGIEMVWPTVGRREPYVYGTDACAGYRCLTGKEISPACYSAQECPAACTGGTCVSITEMKQQCPLKCNSYTGMNPCIDDRQCYYDQETGKCYPYDINRQTCSDPDNGPTNNIQAHTFGFRTIFADDRDKRIRTGGQDACVFGQMREHVCENTYFINFFDINCPAGTACADGACVAAPAIACTDTDGGNKPELFGTTTGVVAWWEPIAANVKPQPDFCTTICEGSVGSGKAASGPCLVEFSCQSHPNKGGDAIYAGFNVHNCANGCQDGACVAAQFCEDSDGGVSAQVYGEVKTTGVSTPFRYFQDKCVLPAMPDQGTYILVNDKPYASAPDCAGQDCYLAEARCPEQLGMLAQSYFVGITCPTGCREGICPATTKTCDQIISDPASASYVDLCRTAGFENVCYNKYTGAYQGCTRNTFNDCTENNMNAARNVLCSAQLRPPQPEPSDIFPIQDLPTNPLNVDENLGDVVETVTADVWAFLKDGVIGNTQYNQYLRFNTQPNNGFLNTDVRSGSVIYAENELDQMGHFLFFNDGDVMFELEIGLVNGFDSQIVNGHLVDLEGKTIPLFKDTYTIISATIDTATNGVKLAFDGPQRVVLADAFADAAFSQGNVEIDNEPIEDAEVRVQGALISQTQFELQAIRYRLRADAVLGDVYVQAGVGLKEQLDEPQGMLGAWDVTFEGVSDNVAKVYLGPIKAPNCIDFDGEDFYTSSRIREVVNNQWITTLDTCPTASRVEERVCIDGRGANKYFDCPAGCQNGACAAAPAQPALSFANPKYQLPTGPGTDKFGVEFTNIGASSTDLSQYDIIFAGNGQQVVIDGVGYLVMPAGTPLLNPGDSSGASTQGTITAPLFAPSACDKPFTIGLLKKGGTTSSDIVVLQELVLNCIPSCVENDGGRNYLVAGSAKGYYKDQSGTWSPFNFNDQCQTRRILREIYCNGNIVTSEKVSCRLGCVNGACRQRGRRR